MFFSRPAGHKYIDRGDRALYDIEESTLTLDGTWQTLDLSAYIPVGTVLVIIGGRFNSPAVGARFLVVENPNNGEYNASGVIIHTASINHIGDLIVKPDKNRIIRYVGSADTWTAIELTIRGWFV